MILTQSFLQVASASADGTVKVWTTAEPMGSEIPPIASQEAPSKKRKKVEEPERTIKVKSKSLKRKEHPSNETVL